MYKPNGIETDAQDGIIYMRDEEEIPYRMSTGDKLAHPMLMHGLYRQSGMLEGTHSVIDENEQMHGLEMIATDIDYINILADMR